MTYDLLQGVRVVELSLYAFAPAAAAVLADWGADVIKVVPPKLADPMMGTPIAGLPEKDVGVAFMWELLNRGKRCIGIDVSSSDGRDRAARPRRARPTSSSRTCFRALATGSGSTAADLRAVNPSLVYAPRHRSRRGRAGAGHRRLRPHRLLGPHRHRPRRQPGRRRVRAAAGTRDGRPRGRCLARRRRSPRRCSAGSARAAARSSTCRCSRRRCGWVHRQ